MTRFSDSLVRPGWVEVLRRVLLRATALGSQGVAIFDLDSTLFNNRPRQARILREFGTASNLSALLACTGDHWDSGWDMKAAMRNCGLPPQDVERVFDDARKFWLERFFTSEYCVDDEAIPGAVEFLKAVVGAGVQVCYVTGRHEQMRQGTVQAMARAGMALPGGEASGGAANVHLIMKPTFDVHDDAFKRDAHAQVAAMGTVFAAFDNEPTHANDYRRTFPEAIVVHLATDHSGRPVDLLEGIVSVPHFGLPAA